MNVARTTDYDNLKHLKSEFKRAFSILKKKHAREPPIDWLCWSEIVDPSGQMPVKNVKELKEKQTEVDTGANVVIEKVERAQKFSFQLKPSQ